MGINFIQFMAIIYYISSEGEARKKGAMISGEQLRQNGVRRGRPRTNRERRTDIPGRVGSINNLPAFKQKFLHRDGQSIGGERKKFEVVRLSESLRPPRPVFGFVEEILEDWEVIKNANVASSANKPYTIFSNDFSRENPKIIVFETREPLPVNWKERDVSMNHSKRGRKPKAVNGHEDRLIRGDDQGGLMEKLKSEGEHLNAALSQLENLLRFTVPFRKF